MREHIEAAKVAHRDAAFRHEVGEGDEAAVIAAKAAISALEDRVLGLDAAWERAKQEAAKEKQEQDAKNRAAAVATVEKHLKARATAARHLEKLAKDLGETWQQYEAAAKGAIEAARPYGSNLGADAFRHLRDVLTGDFHSAKPNLGAAMVDAGLSLQKADFPAAHMRSGMHRDQTLVEFTEKRNAMARAAVSSFVEAE
ncbi:hypothetical protein K7W03_16135 [Sphingobium sp. PNB]|uniref:hypothetical protein n=1 Tax=Sphingobium sp. PNB TaxID=863934 RepID=UPI001CA3F71A|nr:hypothetical protein [Sphingobium sp. PNB]MCB4861121.1 hypothetical protein [Sphingobium sp. PNB]